MIKDKRVKACPNADCDRSKEKYRYKATDQYCTICGTELIFVCAKCFKKISSDDPNHVRCALCEASHEDLKHNREKKIASIKHGVVNAAKESFEAAKKGSAGVAGKAEAAYSKITHSVKSKKAKKRLGKETSLASEETDETSDCAFPREDE